MSADRPPSTADYWVGPIIGQGAFAQVHYGKHKESQRQVAIKVIDQATVRKYPKLLAALLREQKLLSGPLKDVRCVAQLGSSFYDSNCVYMVLELCEGGDLDTYFLSQGMQAESSEERDDWLRSIPSYLAQIRHAIETVHDCHIVHCDIKPANILLSSHGKIKLADFGSAWDLSNPSSKLEDGLRGTTEYSSPELIRNQATDMPKAMDYWSFGCLAVAMYIGRSPFYQQGSESLTVQAILDYERNEDRDSYLEQVWTIGKETNHFDEGALSSYRGLIHPDLTIRHDAWRKLNESEIPVEVVERTLVASRASTSRLSCLPEPKWRASVENCELQDGALGWSVFLL